MSNPKTIAFYLPQFYPIPENDEWWGKGFTEWTNVAKAKPLYPGHYQPRIPADLSFYDLRLESVRELQAKMAADAGIDGFCYWHYWFDGRKLLDHVFDEVVRNNRPDFPFCLCWANHSWEKKDFNNPSKNIMLMEQTYPGKDDFVAHFYSLLPAFKDKRYLRKDGKLIFGIYEPTWIPDPQMLFDTWNELAAQNGLGGFYFFGLVQGRVKYEKCKTLNYDGIVYDCLMDVYLERPGESRMQNLINRAKRKFLKYPMTVSYDMYVSFANNLYASNESIIPCVDPDFDHSPRSGSSWLIMDGSTPEKWGYLYKSVKNFVAQHCGDLLFIKAWNEWGEGNYLEPDMKWGRRYLEAMTE